MKVVKFGGSSLADAAQIEKVQNIIQEDEQRRVVIVSAPGKRNSEDDKVTDLLIALGSSIQAGETDRDIYKKIISRFRVMTEELGLPLSVAEKVKDTIDEAVEMVKDDSSHALDALKACGEDGSARIVSAYLQECGLQASYVNPKEAGIVVRDQPGGALVLEESFDQLYSLRSRNEILVIPGFFGFTPEGELVTFSRGGSDITGSIVAAGLKADLYENFTDVDSVFCVNPMDVDQPKELTSLTYREMRELSYAGFSVFHDEALIPAFKEKIPVCIKNTNNPSAPGTMIVSDLPERESHVVGIASDKGFLNLYVSKYFMNREIGFGRRLLQILEDEGVSFEHAPSGIDDMSVVIREHHLPPEKEEVVVNRIKTELQVDTVMIEREMALIMIVGEGMNQTIGIASRAAAAFREAEVNIEMINQGSSEVSMMFGVKSSGLGKAVKSLYRTFFE
ncbi:aspartate kinase [Halobacillus karajensis]|uniref:Aspartokinase n=1 Tax=Halobacillus karajensis TaxID=195088 RepID=A0A024P7G4_9BACI|nr:aspartate kinase [Halobacillus karajensis]CDQ17881.1 Aspartokinase 3 [Halobacillus karajensis]CDQ24287.1 Aspartokinase 3 [Halobacillus karajensis]CDQ29464.1 Aspartokinase 3 [Halobacillus karajensis]